MLKAEKVHYSIGSVNILRDVSVTVSPGEVVALCGPNGAGKSTLLSILSGEQLPNQGSVSFHQQGLTDWSPSLLAQHRAKLSQESQLTFSFRVSEVVDMGRFPHDTPTEDPAIVLKCMEQVGIVELKDRYYTSLSGGEKQRVHMARVLAQLSSSTDAAKILLLDEPTSALDLMHQEIALEIAHSLSRAQELGVVVVLHDLNLAAAWSDRILMMKDGEIRHSGSPAQVLNETVLRDIYGIGVLVLEHPQTGRPIITIDRSSHPSQASD